MNFGYIFLINYYIYEVYLSLQLLFDLISFHSYFLLISLTSIYQMYVIYLNSLEYGGIANTTHPYLITNSFASFVLWVFALSDVTTILLSWVALTCLSKSSLSICLKKSKNWSSFVVFLLIIICASLFH